MGLKTSLVNFIRIQSIVAELTIDKGNMGFAINPAWHRWEWVLNYVLEQPVHMRVKFVTDRQAGCAYKSGVHIWTCHYARECVIVCVNVIVHSLLFNGYFCISEHSSILNDLVWPWLAGYPKDIQIEKPIFVDIDSNRSVNIPRFTKRLLSLNVKVESVTAGH